MSKAPEVVPAPPEGVILSPVPNKTLHEAQAWVKETLGLEVTISYLKKSTDRGQLTAPIIGPRRMYSTAELFRFLCTRPSRKEDLAV